MKKKTIASSRRRRRKDVRARFRKKKKGSERGRGTGPCYKKKESLRLNSGQRKKKYPQMV